MLKPEVFIFIGAPSYLRIFEELKLFTTVMKCYITKVLIVKSSWCRKNILSYPIIN